MGGANNWDTVTLGEVVTLQRGFDLPAVDRRAGTVPIVSSSGITGSHDEPRVCPPGVVTGRYGTLGQVFYLEEPFWPLNTTLYVKDFHGNHPRFCAYLLECQGFGSRSGAAAVPGVNRNALHRIAIRNPPRPTQRKIAAILSAYDAQIDNNNHRIKILEEMAQRIYREWFVDFRYPNRENVPLIDSELGPIPHGWRVASLKSVCERVVDGDWIETKDQGGSAYRLLQVSNIAKGAFRETGNFRYVSEETFQRLRCTKVRVGYVLVSRMPDPIGRAWYVDHLETPAVTAVDVAIIEPSTQVASGRYIAFSLNTERNLAYAAARASGTTRARITRRDLETFPVLLPPEPILSAFSRLLDGAGDLTLALILQSRNLRETRDLLLPRLISGDIDVADLDIIIEDSAA